MRQPKHYITLGRIPEFIYEKETPEGEFGYQHVVKLPASKQPILARDDKGKLHILRQGNITVTERGIEDIMARRRRRGAMRANPTGLGRAAPSGKFGMAEMGRVALAVGVGGALVVGTGMAINWAQSKAPAAVQNANPYLLAAGKIVLGALGSIGIVALAPDNPYVRTIAGGFGLGAAAAGVGQGVAEFMRPAAPQVPPPPPPGGQAYWPGLPSQQYQYGGQYGYAQQPAMSYAR